MNNIYYIGADVHSNNIELAIRHRGKIVQRFSLPPAISPILEVFGSIKGKKQMAIEEGPMAGWLYRGLSAKVDSFIVAEPRRNKLICSDGDHDDKVDSAKLAMLLEGGFLKEVYHPLDRDQAVLKKWVTLYHDNVRNAVRIVNKIRACSRMEAIKIPANVIKNPEKRMQWLQKLEYRDIAEQLQMLFIGYDAACCQCRIARQKLLVLSRSYPVIKEFQELPGVGIIRAVTFLAYIDTPWRFKRKSKLWKYCGIGLEHTTSGKDKFGQPKPAKLRMPYNCNRTLKDVILGAALSAVRQKQNPFAQEYERMVANGAIPSNARHTVARKLLTTMWGIWKNSYQYNTN
ncbi:MAG: transposase [Clostridia bacterium]|nr:transposase [Clostridia bacterium]